MTEKLAQLDKSFLGLLKLAFDSFIRPAANAKKIKGNVSISEAVIIVILSGLLIGVGVFAFFSILEFSFSLSMGNPLRFVFMLLYYSPIIIYIAIAALVFWFMSTAFVWIISKIGGGSGSYEELVTGLAFPFSGSVIAGAPFIITLIISSIFLIGSGLAISGAGMGYHDTSSYFWAAFICAAIVFGIWVSSIYAYYVFAQEFMTIPQKRAKATFLMPIGIVGTLALSYVTVQQFFQKFLDVNEYGFLTADRGSVYDVIGIIFLAAILFACAFLCVRFLKERFAVSSKKAIAIVTLIVAVIVGLIAGSFYVAISEWQEHYNTSFSNSPLQHCYREAQICGTVAATNENNLFLSRSDYNSCLSLCSVDCCMPSKPELIKD